MSKATYKIFETASFQKESWKKVSSVESVLIQKKLTTMVYPQLKTEPHYGPHIKKLRDYHPETYRYRIGNFRLFYSIDEKQKVVVVTAVRHRKSAYRGS